MIDKLRVKNQKAIIINDVLVGLAKGEMDIKDFEKDIDILIMLVQRVILEEEREVIKENDFKFKNDIHKIEFQYALQNKTGEDLIK